MLPVSRMSAFDSTNQLMRAWSSQYLPDFSQVAKQGNVKVLDLLEAASPEERVKTSHKILRHLRMNCNLGSIRTMDLFASSPHVVNLAEVRQIGSYVKQVYLKLVDVYQRKLFWRFSCSLSDPAIAKTSVSDISALNPIFGLPAFADLSSEIEFVLSELRDQLLNAQDPRAIGFATTQFHFTTKAVFEGISDMEKLLIEPYFRFAEEQVCIPWHQICTAAINHAPDSTKVSMIRELLPQSEQIATAVYSKAISLYPTYQSRRGGLQNPEIEASTLRDIKMFQAYLWLSLLEGNLETIQQRLLPACLMVFPSVQVSWELVDQMLRLLIEEIQARSTQEQWAELSPFTRSLQEIFELSNLTRS
ncbi:hypothetical protein [Phormidesmis priestleyi]